MAEYNSPQAIREAAAQVAELKTKHQNGTVYHLGDPVVAAALGVSDLHAEKNLVHIGFGDFRSEDGRWLYSWMRDTDAGRLYLCTRAGAQ